MSSQQTLCKRGHERIGNCKECARLRTREGMRRWRVKHPGKAQESVRRWREEKGQEWYLRRTYGIGAEDFARMLSVQQGLCAICGLVLETPHVDHCHATGKVRGLLCFDCNTGIGKLKDSVGLLRAAVCYLEASA